VQRHQALNTTIEHHTRMTAMLTLLTARTSKVVTDAAVVPPVTVTELTVVSSSSAAFRVAVVRAGSPKSTVL
jgi:hypothetical protein